MSTKTTENSAKKNPAKAGFLGKNQLSG